jgi:uncharacterized protein (TIGR02172 family)
VSVISLGEPIAQGTVADIHAWGGGQILKLFHGWVPAHGVEWEARVSRAVRAAGLPAPASGGVIEVDGRLGLIYERVEGVSVAERLLGTPEGAKSETIRQLARLFAEVHADIHAHGDVPELASLPQLWEDVIGRVDMLPPDLKEATLKALREMPDGDRLCHGDFHPYNVLMSPRGPVVIDWNNASIGNPMADVALSALILSGVEMLEASYRASVARFHRAYLERYFQLRPEDEQQLVVWQPIVAAVRLNENIPGLQEWLLTQIKTGLA